MPPIKDLDKWKVEIELCEKFRKEEFGEYSRKKIAKAGLNIEYFEKGYSGISYSEVEDDLLLTTMNLFHAITKIITASLYYQNPRIVATPKKMESQDTAPIAAQTLNHFYVEIDAEEVNNHVIWDAYNLGFGVSKLGYITGEGKDIPQEDKEPSKLNNILVSLGLKKQKQEEEKPTYDDSNVNVNSDTPYIKYVSPFNFGKDPRARNINEARYVYEISLVTVKYMKSVSAYKNTSKLKGFDIDDLPTSSANKISQTEIEDFKLVRLYEIHYREPDGIYVLIMSQGENDWTEHFHAKNGYERVKGWQYEELSFNQHSHKLYAISDMTKIRPLQDRINSTIDAILDQVDRFVPKIAYSENDVTEQGKLTLRDGSVGSMIACTKDPNGIFKELNLTQFKADLKALVDNFVDMVSLQTGLTRSQLTGLSDAGTATEATIAQGGQTIRMSDMSKAVSKYLKRQATKLWDVVAERVNLEELELINGQSGVDPNTGLPKYNWLTIDDTVGDKLRNGHYDFDIEVGSTQKPELAILRKQFENFFNILARTDVIMLMQQQGSKVNLAEMLKLYLQLYPEMIKDIGKIVQSIGPATSGLVNPAAMEGNPTTAGSNQNALQSQFAAPTPNLPQELSV